MELFPKFYDSLDSLAFELRMRWAGNVGQSTRAIILLLAIVGGAAWSSGFRHLVIAAIGSFLLAEIATRVIKRSPPGKLLNSRQKATT